jgi:replicative DNA helicase
MSSYSHLQHASHTSPVFGKQMPHSPEAERAVLGALLLNDEYLPQVAEFLVPDDFYQPAHKILFQALLNLTHAMKRVDLVTLQDLLEKEGTLEAIGGIVYLISLQEDIPAIGLLMQHAQLIKEKAILRDLISSAMNVITRCYQQDDHGIDAVLDEAEKTIYHISNKRVPTNFAQLDIWLKKTFQHLSNIKSHSKGITGVASGYKKFDLMTSGFQKGDLVVVAARPSMGKTAILLSIAHHAALNNAVVGFFSLEMAAEQLTLRLLSMESGIPHHNIRNAMINSDEWIELTSVAAQLANLKLFIDDTATVTIMELRAKARRLKAEHGLDILVVDYLQLLHTTKRHENRHQEVSEISRALKALAKELEIPVIAVSQLSRAVDSRMDKRPMLSDLRESGAIEQDADVIAFLYRDVIYNPDTENPHRAELIISKQRNGPTGTIFLTFHREITKFEDSQEE